MGEVYRARDTRLNRDVALKLLPEAFVLDPDRLARFKREAQVLASLNHPHIAAIHGFEDSDGVQALVLELVEGPTLADRIAEGPLPLDEALPIAKQIAEAVEAAHELRVIHRDLKPANIKLRPDGAVKVLDFGLAKALDAGSSGPGGPGGPGGGPGGTGGLTASPTITTPAMTAMGVILGTAAYMSPEQAKGRAADKRSDVWAYGCVLFEMLTGKRAFEGDDVSDTLAAVLRGEPDWTALPAGMPSGIRLLIQRCLVKDRRQRVADIAVAQFVLGDSANHGPSQRPGPVAALVSRSRWKSATPVAAAVLLTAIVVGLVAWISLRLSRQATPVVRFSLTLPDVQLFPATSRRLVSLSPDGTQIVYVASGRLFIRSLSDFEARAIPGGEAVAAPVGFSADGRSIAFFADGAIKRIAASGGAAVTVCPADFPFGMTWDSTGIVLGQGRKGIVRCSPDGGTPTTLARVGDDEEAQGGQMLAGGRVVLFAVAKVADGLSRWDKAQVVVQTLSSGARKTLINGGTDASYVRTGHLLYSLGGVVFAVRFDPARQTVSGGPVPVLEGVRRSASANTGSVQFSLSETGTAVYLPGPVGTATADRALALADRAGTVTRLPVPPGPFTHVRASRDGARLAIGTDDAREAIVWVYDVGSTTSMRRLTLTGRNRFPIWSADGQRVAYQSDREGDLAVFMQRADGTGAIERLTKSAKGEAHVPESWSPDGKHILFSAARGSVFTLWSLSVGDRQATPFGAVRSAEPIGSTFSPDGRWVAYGSTPDSGGPTGPRSPNRGVFIQPFPPTGERYQVPKLERDYHPVWDPKGGALFYVPVASRVAVVGVTTKPAVTFSTPVQLPARVTASRLSVDERAFDVLPDGRFVGLVFTGDDPNSSGSARPAYLGPGLDAAQIRVVLNWFEELKQRVPAR